MDGFLRQSTSANVNIGVFADRSDGSRKTGIEVSADNVFVLKSGTTAEAKNSTADCVSAFPGTQICVLSATDTDTPGILRVECSVGVSVMPVFNMFQVVEESIFDKFYASGGALNDLSSEDVSAAVDDALNNFGVSTLTADDVSAEVEDALAGHGVSTLTAEDVSAACDDALVNLGVSTLDSATVSAAVDDALVNQGLDAINVVTIGGQTPTFDTGILEVHVVGTDANVIDAAAISTDAGNEIADAILKRDVDQVEAAAAVHTLTGAILKAASRVADDNGTLKTFRTDGTTLFMSQVVSASANLDPVAALGAAS